MKPLKLTITVAAATLVGLASCEVKKTEEGNLPDVKTEGDVELPKYEVRKTEAGNLPEVRTEGEVKLPEYDVQGPDVEVGSKQVEVPTIDIQTPAEQRAEQERNDANKPPQ